MKVLLTTLNSKYVHSSLALRCLYSAAAENLQNYDIKIEIKEFTINNDDDFILNELIYFDYDVICFSINIWNADRIIGITEVLKKALPNVKLLAGGPEVSNDPVAFMKDSKHIDFLIVGEGEYAFTALCSQGFAGPELPAIGGLIYRNRADGKIYVNPPGEALKMESLPFPYRYLPFEKDKTIYYESSRGCPFNCSYCMSSIEKSIRALPVERVKEDLNQFISANVEQVKFVDRTFNWDRERCRELWQHLIENDNGITNWHFEICAELLDRQLIDLLNGARKGLFQIEAGIQSTNPKTLAAVNRSTDIEPVFENLKEIVACGNTHVHVDLIVGLPFEGYNTFKDSFNRVFDIHADHLQMGFLKLLKGTALRNDADKYGYVFRKNPPYHIISNDFISARDIIRLKQVETVLNLFSNRGGFENTVDYFISLNTSAFDFFEEMALYYYLKGYHHKSHKKEDLYRILRQYAYWKDRSCEGAFNKATELLYMDMENTLNPDAIKKFNKKGWKIE